jgi:predicted RNase H-like nuclease (RuvC/YqgF family)
MDIISLIASAVSVAIGAFAIWLSVTFYRMSSGSSKEIKQASAQIDTTVKRLEALFDKLYSDTFSMVKDTVSDMRAHIWRAPRDIDGDAKNNTVIERFSSQIEELLKRQTGTISEVDELRRQITAMAEEAIAERRRIDSRAIPEEVETRILAIIPQIENATLNKISRSLMVNEGDVVSALFRLGRKHAVAWPGAPDQLSASDVIRLVVDERSGS